MLSTDDTQTKEFLVVCAKQIAVLSQHFFDSLAFSRIKFYISYSIPWNNNISKEYFLKHFYLFLNHNLTPFYFRSRAAETDKEKMESQTKHITNDLYFEIFFLHEPKHGSYS